jgi:thiamine kinase-like enzyme
MNPIKKLLDEKYVDNFFSERLLPRYPGFIDIEKIEINPIKKHIWEETYHVVIEFITTFKTDKGKKITLPIYCSAHSSEPRKNVYDGMKFLWDHGFYRGKLTIPRPLFYSNHFKATFYRGIRGRNLYRFIREQDKREIEGIVPKAAGLFAKLHNLPTNDARNFNRKNSRIDTAIPGVSHINYRMKKKYPDYYYPIKKILSRLVEAEQTFLKSTKQRWLVHGDAHPENIIKVSKRKVGLIDFTDLCLSDFARDIGTFMQQLEYMMNRKFDDSEYIKTIISLFLESYEKYAKIKIDKSLKKRIEVYFYWTAMRTACMFLLQSKPEPDRAQPLIEQTAQTFNIKL